MSDLWIYPASFLAGLGLNLTPCVYPMVSITISIFSANQSNTLKQSALRSAAYVAGVVAMYSSLGSVAVLSGGLFGAWMQQKAVLGAIGLVFLALALSMFGLWRLEAPRFILDRAAKLSNRGYLGLFLSGLFVGVFAAPCIGPPVAAILAWAGSAQAPAKAFTAILLMGAGLGAPYLVLGVLAGRISRLPKSGDWLIWFERVFAVILSGFAAYYLSLAFYSELIPLILPATLILGGGYLGFLQKSGETNRWFKWFKRILAIFIITAGVFLLQPSHPDKIGLTWQPFDEPAFTHAVMNGEPTALDFYADWCLPCHEMDRITY
ncbi:MAG: sulfite exporter TauE/SafE family protein, partial [Candidatus Omnitrophica bacterium]|nr:sulfite exporter TauE/SafE family protein [Candidatus Omnitrophota bacterium]